MPHSDIRGSTIARISPRLFAACHVLHRLLAPRHPPDALLTLITSLIQPPPARRTKPHTRTPRPKPKSTSTQGPTPQRPIRSAAVPANSHTQSTCRPANKPQPASTPTCAPQLPIHLSMNMPQHRPKSGTAETSAGKPTTRTPSGAQGQQMEAIGFEPTTPCLQSRRSPTELRPHERYLCRPAAPAGSPPATNGQAEMGQGGLEPPTPRLSSVCSNQLSYWPQPKPQAHQATGKARTQTRRGMGSRMDQHRSSQHATAPHPGHQASRHRIRNRPVHCCLGTPQPGCTHPTPQGILERR